MSDQQTTKLLEEAADIRRRFASETNSELRAQLTARYYQIEAELKALKTSASATRTEAQSKSATQNSTASITPIEVSEPFGIPLRVPLGQLGIGACDLGNGARVLRTVPKPHSFFDLYIVHTSSDSVVTAVMAFKTIFPVNRYGTELRSHFQLISSRLERIYGEPSKVMDFVDEDSRFVAQEQWLLGLMEGERMLSAEWDSRASIPADLKRIWLYAGADSNRECQITLRYESIDYEIDPGYYYPQEDEAL